MSRPMPPGAEVSVAGAGRYPFTATVRARWKWKRPPVTAEEGWITLGVVRLDYLATRRLEEYIADHLDWEALHNDTCPLVADGWDCDCMASWRQQ